MLNLPETGFYVCFMWDFLSSLHPQVIIVLI